LIRSADSDNSPVGREREQAPPGETVQTKPQRSPQEAKVDSMRQPELQNEFHPEDRLEPGAESWVETGMVDHGPKEQPGSPPTISVLLVDGQSLLREMLADRLRREENISVKGTAHDAASAMAAAAQLSPDVVVMDLDSQRRDGTGPLDAIQSACPHLRFVLLGAFVNDGQFEWALTLNGTAYVSKTESFSTVVEAIRTAAAGRAYFSPGLRSRVAIGSTGARLAQPISAPLASLSPRELEILRHIAQGLSKKQIAQLLHISAKTVENHAANLMEKLALHDRVALTRFAIREGLTLP
jgi:DNA-binding NarL/FixJ family response regulator